MDHLIVLSQGDHPTDTLVPLQRVGIQTESTSLPLSACKKEIDRAAKTHNFSAKGC